MHQSPNRNSAEKWVYRKIKFYKYSTPMGPHVHFHIFPVMPDSEGSAIAFRHLTRNFSFSPHFTRKSD